MLYYLREQINKTVEKLSWRDINMCKKFFGLLVVSFAFLLIPLTANACIIDSLESIRIYDADGNDATNYINSVSLTATVTQEDIVQASYSRDSALLENPSMHNSLLSVRAYDAYGNDITKYITSISLEVTMNRERSMTFDVVAYWERDMGPVATIWINCPLCNAPLIVSLFRTGVITKTGHRYTATIRLNCCT